MDWRGYRAMAPWHLGGTALFVVGAVLFVQASRDGGAARYVVGGVLYAVAMGLVLVGSRRLQREQRRAREEREREAGGGPDEPGR